MVRRLKKIYNSATPQEHAEGVAWYAEANKLAAALAAETGHTVATVAGVIAVTSPRNSWERNVEIANLLVKGEQFTAYMSCQLRKAAHILDGSDPLDVLKGLKERNFYLSILEPEGNACCVDRHVVRAAIDLRKGEVALSTRDYASIVQAVAEAAHAAGVSSPTFQAVLWVRVRSIRATAHFSV